LDDAIDNATIEIETIKQHAEQTKGGSGDETINVMDMVKRQGELYKLQKEIKVWQRKVDIAEANAHA